MDKHHYVEKAEICKVLSDSNRLQIIEMLSCGEMCVCKILEKLDITQPTLSHHLKVLADSGIVTSRKEANWVHYQLQDEKLKEIHTFLHFILNSSKSGIGEP